MTERSRADEAVDEEVMVFLERYAAAHLGGGAAVAGMCHLPCLAVEAADGAAALVQVLDDDAAATAYFDRRAARWRAAGAVDARANSVRTRPLGKAAAVTTVQWRLLDAAGRDVAEPTATYELLRTPLGVRLVCFTAHEA